VRAILNAPDLTTRLGVRDRAMMHLCFAGGLRVSELVGVLLENIELHRTPSVMVRGKGRKERRLPLWKETARDIRAWLSVRGPMRTPELFVNAEGTAMTRAGFEYVLDKHVRAATQSCPTLAGRTVSPHQLRHSCAVIMLQATRDIRKVALWLGHADIRTTEVYLIQSARNQIESLLSCPTQPDALKLRERVRSMIERVVVIRHESGMIEVTVRGRLAGVMAAAGLVERYALKHGPQLP
jgi:site-specific recombinase XerD